MKNLHKMSAKASFRPRELHDFNKPMAPKAIRLQVRPSLWQRFLQAIGF